MTIRQLFKSLPKKTRSTFNLTLDFAGVQINIEIKNICIIIGYYDAVVELMLIVFLLQPRRMSPPPSVHSRTPSTRGSSWCGCDNWGQLFNVHFIPINVIRG